MLRERKIIPYGRQSINQLDIDAVIKVLKSNYLTTGPKIAEFENALAKYCGAKYAVVVCNGTAALHLAYAAAGLEVSDEIITTPNTFVATTNMMLNVGAVPVFCDIREDNYNIDETKIEKLITEKTKAIVPVHFAGHPCEMKKIRKIANKFNLLIIEDACHALGAKYQGSKIGACRFSDLTVFSFHPVKSITTGEGGAILTNNRQYYEKMKLLRSHGTKKDKNGFNVMLGMGYNYRLTDFQAALGISQLKNIDKFISKRHELVELYRKELAGCEQIILPQENADSSSSWHLYVIRTKKVKDRLPLYKFLLRNGIGVNFHYPVVYKHPYYQKHLNIKKNCGFAELFEKTVITLPLFPSLTQADIKFISGRIKTFFKSR